MANSITTKYGTKINTTGLTPEQIKKVKSIAEDNGAYGSKGAALAEQFRKQAAKAPAPAQTLVGQNPAPAAPGASSIDAETRRGLNNAQANQLPQAPMNDQQTIDTIKGLREAAPNANTPALQIQPTTQATAAPAPAAPAAPAAPKKKKITTKYGTVIDVTGLSDQQVEKVRSMAEDKGAYGTKGAALAKSLQAKLPKTGTGQVQDPAPMDPDPGAGSGFDNTDSTQDIKSGRTGGLEDGSLGGFNPKGGAFENTTDIFGQAPVVPGSADLQGDIDKVRDANYQYLSRDFATNKAQEMETAKQELANRGIPFDPNPDSLYGRTMKQLEQKYGDLDIQARQQAIMGGDSSFSTQVGAADTANQAFYRGVFGLTDAELNKYNIDENTRVALKKIAADRASQKEQIARSGGGSQQETGIIMGGGIAP